MLTPRLNVAHALGFAWSKWTTGKPAEQRLALIPAGQEHILEQEDGKQRFVQVVNELSRAFALCAASDEATDLRESRGVKAIPTPNSASRFSYSSCCLDLDQAKPYLAES